MSDEFDPYHRWLGIPPEKQPPNYYQLLGVAAFESDPAVIRNSADRLMRYVKTFQSGPKSKLSQQILNELAAARVCLETPTKKADYDAQLRAKIPPAAAAPLARAAPPVAAPMNSAEPPLPVAVSAPPMNRHRQSRPSRWGWHWIRSANQSTWLVAGIALSIFIFGALTGIFVSHLSFSGSSSKVSGAANFTSAESTDEKQQAKLVGPPPGVVAERVVLWNQHNSRHQDRGARSCRVRVYSGAKMVWQSGEVTLAWSQNKSESTTIALPRRRFDRLRVEIPQWHGNGGGLAEIQVVSGGGNLAYGRPASASASFGFRFRPEKITDGITTSSTSEIGYWLLPDKVGGWIEVDLARPVPHQSTITAEQVVLWNAHHPGYNNSGTHACHVILKRNSKEVWRKDNVKLNWRADRDASTIVKLPSVEFDALRIHVVKPVEHSGLSEVQILRDGVNLALGCPVIGDSAFSAAARPNKVVDGVIQSNRRFVGYWITGRPGPGWVEIDVSCVDPNEGQSNQQVGEYFCLSPHNWQRGLKWLARGNHLHLRVLADKDLEAPRDAAELVALGDTWRALSAQRGGFGVAMRLRAAYHYAKAIPKLSDLSRSIVEDRLEQLLPELAQKNYLFFQKERAVKGVLRNQMIRDAHCVVNGEVFNYGLWMHPAKKGSTRAVFHLDKHYRLLQGAVAINDSAITRSASPLTFRIVGDGHALWSSSPLQDQNIKKPFKVNMTGVKVLELFVDCPGSHRRGHAVWLDPQLER